MSDSGKHAGLIPVVVMFGSTRHTYQMRLSGPDASLSEKFTGTINIAGRDCVGVAERDRFGDYIFTPILKPTTRTVEMVNGRFVVFSRPS